MRFLQAIVSIAFMIGSVAWVSGARGALTSAPGGHRAGASLDQAKQQQLQRQTEVRRLEHDVVRQQSDSDRASQRLQQQDKSIAELRKQLQELKARRPVGQH